MRKMKLVAAVIHSKGKSAKCADATRVIVSCDGKQVAHADFGGFYTCEQGLTEFRKNRNRFKLTQYGTTIPAGV